jgi:hypothetical protein
MGLRQPTKSLADASECRARSVHVGLPSTTRSLSQTANPTFKQISYTGLRTFPARPLFQPIAIEEVRRYDLVAQDVVSKKLGECLLALFHGAEPPDRGSPTEWH